MKDSVGKRQRSPCRVVAAIAVLVALVCSSFQPTAALARRSERAASHEFALQQYWDVYRSNGCDRVRVEKANHFSPGVRDENRNVALGLSYQLDDSWERALLRAIGIVRHGSVREFAQTHVTWLRTYQARAPPWTMQLGTTMPQTYASQFVELRILRNVVNRESMFHPEPV